MVSDFSKEERLLRNIENILTRQEGREDKHSLQSSMMDLLINDFFKLPREKLDTIYELLDNLSNAGWDVTLHKERHSALTEHVDKSIENLKNIANTEYPNAAEGIDRYIKEYRRGLCICF